MSMNPRWLKGARIETLFEAAEGRLTAVEYEVGNLDEIIDALGWRSDPDPDLELLTRWRALAERRAKLGRP